MYDQSETTILLLWSLLIVIKASGKLYHLFSNNGAKVCTRYSNSISAASLCILRYRYNGTMVYKPRNEI